MARKWHTSMRLRLKKHFVEIAMEFVINAGSFKGNIRNKHWHFSQIGNRHIEVRTCTEQGRWGEA